MRPIPEYNCKICNFSCSIKRLFNQHLRTLSHRSSVSKTQSEDYENIKYIKCHGCGGIFGSRTSLWRHKKECIKSIQKKNGNKLSNINNEKENESESEKEITDDQTEKASKLIDNAILMEVLKETKVLREAFEEQTKTIENLRIVNERQHKIIEENLPLITGSKHTTNNITNVMNNPNFNINVFLNEQCKNAINLSDFVQSIVVKIEDLEKTKSLGFVKGVTDIIVKNLRQLDIYSRPIHCSDPLKEILYIKNDNIWCQDKEDKPMVKNAITAVAKKQLDKVKDWEEQNPNWVCSEQGTTEYIKMVRQVTSSQNDAENKIMKNIAREVVIKKSQ